VPETSVSIRTGIKPGDLGAIMRLHGVLYAEEYGLDWTFELYIAQGYAEAAEAFTSGKARLWVVEDAGEVVGSIAIVGHSPGSAQLRWFLLHPKARGQGLGRRLLKEAVEFSRASGYQRIFLWTLCNLEAAIHLYRAFGFQKMEEATHRLWGQTLTEERYELSL
jgi:ribosomal protein S18 acetylase RimI-like enzyme